MKSNVYPLSLLRLDVVDTIECVAFSSLAHKSTSSSHWPMPTISSFAGFWHFCPPWFRIHPDIFKRMEFSWVSVSPHSACAENSRVVLAFGVEKGLFPACLSFGIGISFAFLLFGLVPLLIFLCWILCNLNRNGLKAPRIIRHNHTSHLKVKKHNS